MRGRRLTEEEKEKIRELQEAGCNDAEISRKLGIPHSTVRYQRPKVKEKVRKYLREYKREYRLKLDPEFQEFLTFLENRPNYREIPSNNIYFAILKCLSLNKEDGLTFRQLEGRTSRYRGNIIGPLKKLINKGILSTEREDTY